MAKTRKNSVKTSTVAEKSVAVEASAPAVENVAENAAIAAPVTETPESDADTSPDTEAASVTVSVPRKAVSDTVVVALCNPTGITFDLSGNRRVTLKGNAEGLRGKEKGNRIFGWALLSYG